MTLIMTILRPEGIWQSSDHRVTAGGRVKDDETPKQLLVLFTPDPLGPRMILGFTGLAIMSDGTPTLQWIRETVRGVQRSPTDMVGHLSERLKRDHCARKHWREPLLIVGGLLEGDKRFLCRVHNLASMDDWRTHREATHQIEQIDFTGVLALGSGARYISDADRALLEQQVMRKPARWGHHLGLLAGVNRRTAERTSTVSRSCRVHGITPEETMQGRFFRPGESPAPEVLETLLCGVDISEISRLMVDANRDLRPGEIPRAPDSEEAGRRSVRPRD